MKHSSIKMFLGVVGVFMAMGAGCGSVNTNQIPDSTSTVNGGIETPKDTTINGTWVCLPHQVKGDMETMECAYGVKSDDGKHYALDLSAATLPADLMSSLKINDRISVSGLLVPIEQISNNQWDKYDVRGIIKVSGLEKK